MTETPPLRINTLTAAPLLRPLLALEGMEPPDLDPERAWAVFKRFVSLPAESPQDLATFQAHWHTLSDDTPQLACLFARPLSDDATGFETTRSIQIEYIYDLPYSERLAELEVWSDEFPSLDAFFAHVEKLPHFRMMREQSAVMCDLYAEEPE